MGTEFRSPVSTTPTVVPATVDSKEVKVSGDSNVEVPFLDYRSEYKKPFCADFFELGDIGDNSIYDDDIGKIETYLKEQIDKGKMTNSITSAKEKLKQMEKMIGYDKTERTVVKMAKLAAYVKFLSETDEIESQSNKYV
jgi:hypothetical protein